MQTAERKNPNDPHSLFLEDLPLTYNGGDISPIYRVMVRKSQEIYQACDQQVKTRVTPYHEALQAFCTATENKISATFKEVYMQL